ncbi:MAG TPA: dihydrodipicolinate reductase C-terminal domain-containing protein [Gemmatimonadaceae bacterium]|jgi:4-hydroxy-tetrahydrodipicolinate reductase
MNARRKLALIGMGKMGRVIEQLASERGWEVVARIGADTNRDGAGVTRALLKSADVAIEFTTPKAAGANIRAAVAARCPIVVGTTGWFGELPALSEWVAQRGGALLTAANFSLGVNAFEQIVAVASRLLSSVAGFDAHLVETHHAAKKDAPSGTAITLRAAAARTWPREIPITSIRIGSVPGTHELVFDAPFETVTLAHVARDRRVFAEGALVAAAWLIGRTGVFTMRDVLDGGHSRAGET